MDELGDRGLRKPCALQIRDDVFPIHPLSIAVAMRSSIAPAMQGRLITVAMSGFGERVRKRREDLGMTQPELARASGIKQPTISNIERGRNKGSQHIVELAAALKVRPQWLNTGVGPKEIGKGEVPPAVNDDTTARDAREEILLLLYCGLFSLQQERLIVGLRAMFEANQFTRKELGQKTLVGVSDDQVRKAYGDAPFHRMKRIERKSARRDPGTAMDDFFE